MGRKRGLKEEGVMEVWLEGRGGGGEGLGALFVGLMDG